MSSQSQLSSSLDEATETKGPQPPASGNTSTSLMQRSMGGKHDAEAGKVLDSLLSGPTKLEVEMLELADAGGWAGVELKLKGFVYFRALKGCGISCLHGCSRHTPPST